MLLEALSNAPGASGNEGAVRKIIVEALKDVVDDLTIDTMGNVFALKKSTQPNAKRVMIAAHMDEVGFMVSSITGAGMLKFETVGGFDPRILPGSTVLVGQDKIPGVMGLEALHLTKADARRTAPKIEGMAIDVGANKKDQAAAKVSLGDYAVFATQFGHLNSDPNDKTQGVVKGKAFDDRVGCAVLVELLQRDHPVEVMGVFTVQEEVGLRGAKVAAYRAKPDLAIVLECTAADDLPNDTKEPDDVPGYPRLGNGPVITLIDRTFIADQDLIHLLTTAAEANDIPYQFKRPNVGGTDAGYIHISRAGVPSAVVSVPSRYIHGPTSLIELRDFHRTVELVSAGLQAMAE